MLGILPTLVPLLLAHFPASHPVQGATWWCGRPGEAPPALRWH